MSINSVALCGNITRNADVRQTKSGMPITSFGIAVNDRRKNPLSGEWEDVPNFFDVTVFGKYGETLSNRLVTGAKVALNGSLRWSQWEKDGQKRSKVEVIADDIELFTAPKPKEPAMYEDDCPF